MKILNSFSLNMIESFPASVVVMELAPEAARAHVRDNPESCVGHADAAVIFSKMLDVSVPVNRVTVKLTRYESILVGQYRGPRLPEGATTLPEGATIQWLLVDIG